MGIVSQRLRDSARGQPCSLQIPGVCNHDPATTVLAHIPSEIKAMATKSDDFNACVSCSSCHEAIDLHILSKEDELYYMLRGLQRTMHYWVSIGLVSVPESKSTPKPSSKIVPRRHIATGERL